MAVNNPEEPWCTELNALDAILPLNRREMLAELLNDADSIGDL